jgi:hypothetical protein
MGIRLGTKIYQSRPGMLMFECPGCDNIHPVYIDRSYASSGVVQQWAYNNNPNKPTFSPSIDIFRDNPALRCHSFVTDGKIMFLPDSHHHLKGCTVELPDWD